MSQPDKQLQLFCLNNSFTDSQTQHVLSNSSSNSVSSIGDFTESASPAILVDGVVFLTSLHVSFTVFSSAIFDPYSDLTGI